MFPPKPKAVDFIHYHDEDEPDPLIIPDKIYPGNYNGVALYEQLITDHWINNEVFLPRGESNSMAKVIGCSKDADGNIIGSYSYNPFLNTLVYDFEFPD